MKLALAGSHQEFLEWLATTGRAPGDYRPVREQTLWALHAVEVDELHLVGRYWLNPVWGSDDYRRLMNDGVARGSPWAAAWPLDWVVAEQLRSD